MHVPGLYLFFRRHVQQGFGEQGFAQPALVDYVSELLTRFARVNVLFPFHNADGRPIETIAGLLMEWQAVLGNDTARPGRAREPSMTSLSFLRQMLHDVRHQKIRTLLTVFGITWGTVSVALLVASRRSDRIGTASRR